MPVAVLSEKSSIDAVHQVRKTLHHRRLFLCRQRADDFSAQLCKVLQTTAWL